MTQKLSAEKLQEIKDFKGPSDQDVELLLNHIEALEEDKKLLEKQRQFMAYYIKANLGVEVGFMEGPLETKE